MRAKETMKTKTFLIPRVVQVPTGVWQVALQNWIALHKTLDFFVSGGQVFLPSFSGSFDESLSRRLVSGCQEPRTAQCSALRHSRSLQHQLRPRGRWARSGKLSSGSQQFAGFVGSDVATRAGAVSTSSARSWRALEARNILPATKFLLGLLAVMERGSVLRVDEGRLAPCRGRSGRRVSLIVTFVSLLRTCLTSHLHWFRMLVCFLFIPRWCLKIRVCRTVWVP